MKNYFLTVAIAWGVLCAGPAFSQRETNPRQSKHYNLEQATSERAQLHTVAFSGLAFLTGNFGADTFFPPGKVADFFGFQFMRDNDKNEKGHNTDFLTRIANSVFSVLTDEQLDKLKQLAREQAPVYDAFARKRFELIRFFRDYSEKGIQPNLSLVKKCGAELYLLDAELSYGRAVAVGQIIRSFSAEQKAALNRFQFDNSSTWLDVSGELDKRGLSHREHVCVMTYASEIFSWYAGSLEADVYFCPERHGSFFGGFYLKDFPAMGNPGYDISTALTGDSGRDFMTALTDEQRSAIAGCMLKQKPLLAEIVGIRKIVCSELRKAISGEMPDKTVVFARIKQYGELDAEFSFYMAGAFSFISKTSTEEQKIQFAKIRNQKILPKGIYLYSDPIPASSY